RGAAEPAECRSVQGQLPVPGDHQPADVGARLEWLPVIRRLPGYSSLEHPGPVHAAAVHAAAVHAAAVHATTVHAAAIHATTVHAAAVHAAERSERSDH